jgi:hypothetical protein
VLWLDPKSPESFPSGLLEALSEHASATNSGLVTATTDPIQAGNDAALATRLRRQIQADRLQRLDGHGSDEDEQDGDGYQKSQSKPSAGGGGDTDESVSFDAEVLQEATQFLRLQVS